MPVAKAKEFEYAFPLNKQANISTAVATGQITKNLPFRGFAPFFVEHPAFISDRGWYGKGHSHATFYDPIQKLVRIPARDYSMTQLSALFGPAFVLGDLSSSRPNSSTAPTVWDHVFTYQDPSTHPDCLYTSMIEKAAGEYQKIIHGAVINSFTLTGNRNDHVVVSQEGFARWMADDVTAMPALASSQSFFRIIKATFQFGSTPPSGPLPTISTEVLGFNLTFTQNADTTTAWLPGAPSGEEHLMGRVLIGDQAVSGQLMVFLDEDKRNLFLNQTECALIITLLGDQIGSTGFYHTVTIEIPHFKIASESFAEEGQTTSYTIPITEDAVLKNASDPYVRYTVRTNIDNTELLVAA